MVALVVLALAPLLWRRHLTERPTIVALCAGLAFALSSVATKLFTDASTGSNVIEVALLLVMIGAAATVGGITQMSALQRRPATVVIPVAFATEVLVPVGLAPVVFNERLSGVSTVSSGLLVVALIAVILGVWMLASSPLVGDMIAAGEHEAAVLDSA